MQEIIISGFLGYLLGCFQTSIFLGKIFKKVDIREHGSKNAGASNTIVVFGMKFGVLTALLDILKAVLAVVIVRYLYPNDLYLHVLAGVAAIMGHIFPVFFKFKGGKGVASLIGTILALNLKLGALLVLIALIVAFVSDYVVVGSTTIYLLFVGMMIFGNYPKSALVLSVLTLIVAIFKHRENYENIRSKKELGIRSTLRGDEKQYRV